MIDALKYDSVSFSENLSEKRSTVAILMKECLGIFVHSDKRVTDIRIIRRGFLDLLVPNGKGNARAYETWDE